MYWKNWIKAGLPLLFSSMIPRCSSVSSGPAQIVLAWKQCCQCSPNCPVRSSFIHHPGHFPNPKRMEDVGQRYCFQSVFSDLSDSISDITRSMRQLTWPSLPTVSQGLVVGPKPLFHLFRYQGCQLIIRACGDRNMAFMTVSLVKRGQLSYLRQTFSMNSPFVKCQSQVTTCRGRVFLFLPQWVLFVSAPNIFWFHSAPILADPLNTTISLIFICISNKSRLV